MSNEFDFTQLGTGATNETAATNILATSTEKIDDEKIMQTVQTKVSVWESSEVTFELKDIEQVQQQLQQVYLHDNREWIANRLKWLSMLHTTAQRIPALTELKDWKKVELQLKFAPKTVLTKSLVEALQEQKKHLSEQSAVEQQFDTLYAQTSTEIGADFINIGRYARTEIVNEAIATHANATTVQHVQEVIAKYDQQVVVLLEQPSIKEKRAYLLQSNLLSFIDAELESHHIDAMCEVEGTEGLLLWLLEAKRAIQSANEAKVKEKKVTLADGSQAYMLLADDELAFLPISYVKEEENGNVED